MRVACRAFAMGAPWAEAWRIRAAAELRRRCCFLRRVWVSSAVRSGRILFGSGVFSVGGGLVVDDRSFLVVIVVVVLVLMSRRSL
ncbi:hypothetical protein BJX61DRAFT_523781 [Aspergillus egyptiacus]|nr:hypothetical protein BJX61DRAFT_523781 [Aspergillus egyptiacus]